VILILLKLILTSLTLQLFSSLNAVWNSAYELTVRIIFCGETRGKSIGIAMSATDTDK